MFPFSCSLLAWMAALTKLGSIGLPSQPRLLPSLSSLHVSFSGSWVGWVVRGKAGPHSAPFIRMGGPRSRGWAPIKRLLGRMGGPRPTSWAPIIGSWVARLLGRMGGPRPRSCWAPFLFLSGLLLQISFLGSWVGWGFHWAPFTFLGSCGRIGPFLFASFGKEAGFLLGSLHISFLGSWVGWVGRCQEAFWAPGSDGWAAAKKLGSRSAPFMFPSFWVLGPDGWPRQRMLGSIDLPSYFLSGLLGRMGGPARKLGSR